MRVICTGSRDWPNPNAARHMIANRLCDLPSDTLIVHGGARGADRFVHDEALKLGLPLPEVHRPDYERYSPHWAPKQRNIEMAQLGADLCIAFLRDECSTGTSHMIGQAEKHSIPVEIISL